MARSRRRAAEQSGCRLVAVSRWLKVYFFGRGQTIENYNPLILLIKMEFIGSLRMRPDSVFLEWGARGREFESRRPDQRTAQARYRKMPGFLLFGASEASGAFRTHFHRGLASIVGAQVL
jgi:hypothetical protein